MNDFVPALKKRLRENGWELLRHGKGDHDIWYDPQTGRKVAIDHKIKSRHTANAVLEQAGLAKAF
ncbi:type II toxin-antitoxin system HicA family toxin [Mesorhizobium sp. RP14(2022)]|uniref:Type II toxin-antitoxin system HicA family toxin n=1 Tax=Mesorhizobium liriopis TaxID=2953882 RepID=A0ABT1C045_9HYPH|nr:type II toxin-antitoxin system HicA family toxin [Mesorhizobium liriopis]MCO6048206.1 type II toxin-antitoxin system HicA family toxin [Mesorhizobium liriopis]